MGMIVKSIVAGVVLAGLAGGGVYYGLAPEGLDGLGLERQTERREPIAAKKVTVQKAANADHPHADKKTKADTKKTETKSEKKWIDQYLDSESTDDEEKSKSKTTTKKTVTTTVVESQDTDEMLDKDVTAKADKKRVYKTAKSDPIIIKDADVSAEVVAEIKTLLDELEMNESSEVIIAKAKVKSKASAADTATMESFETLNIITKEAEQIDSSDLKDRAYLSVVDYALVHGYFGEAKDALPSIQQPELRETARSRIAVKYAMTGNPDAAFGMVESVEIEDFKDPLRVQIIEALIGVDPAMDARK